MMIACSKVFDVAARAQQENQAPSTRGACHGIFEELLGPSDVGLQHKHREGFAYSPAPPLSIPKLKHISTGFFGEAKNIGLPWPARAYMLRVMAPQAKKMAISSGEGGKFQ